MRSYAVFVWFFDGKIRRGVARSVQLSDEDGKFSFVRDVYPIVADFERQLQLPWSSCRLEVRLLPAERASDEAWVEQFLMNYDSAGRVGGSDA